MTIPNRKDARDTWVALLNTIAGDGQTLQEVINADVGKQMEGQSPVAVVMSAGSDRKALVRRTAILTTRFRFATIVFVSTETTNCEDVLDGIEQEIADLIATVANRSGANWHYIDYEDGFSVVDTIDISGHPYRMEVIMVVVTLRK